MVLTTVTISNWAKYNTRKKDLKHAWWFSCSNNILEDPELEHFSNAELNVWIFLLSTSSKKQSASVTISPKLVTKMRRRFRKRDFDSALKKLQVLKIIEFDTQDTAGSRPSDGRAAAATGHDIHTEQDTTVDSKESTPVFDFETPYQKYPRKEGKSAGLAECQKQIKTREDYDLFLMAVDRTARCHRKRGTREDKILCFNNFMRDRENPNVTPWRDWAAPEMSKWDAPTNYLPPAAAPSQPARALTHDEIKAQIVQLEQQKKESPEYFHKALDRSIWNYRQKLEEATA